MLESMLLSEVPGDPTFQSSSVNAVALVPLLSSGKKGEISTTYSSKAFANLLQAFRRFQIHQENQNELVSGDGAPPSSGGGGGGGGGTAAPTAGGGNNGGIGGAGNELLLVVPNSSLTRPGDWRYGETPLKGFHWQHGCQRLRLFDGRPDGSRTAHDRLINQRVARDWIDIRPNRRTAAIIGVLSIRDCHSSSDLDRAGEELRQWANRYATPPYEVTAHGRNFERDSPVERLFVFDSFHEDCQGIDLSSSRMGGNSILAFPPVDESNDEFSEMMNLHLKIVINDLAVTVFRSIERKIQDSDAISSSLLLALPGAGGAQQQQEEASLASTARRSITRLISASSSDAGGAGAVGGTPSNEEPVAASKRVSLRDMAGFVSPESKLGKESPKQLTPRTSPRTSSSDLAAAGGPYGGATAQDAGEGGGLAAVKYSNSTPKLITPLDKHWEQSSLTSRDFEAIRKRDAARREKWAADLTLLAGSPLDAYERYLKAAEMCKTGSPDPLWYASALEGCAAAHIAMAEAGGYGVDEYLESNFQMPEEIMALEKGQAVASSSKQTLPEVVFALCEEALNITNRHEKLGPIHAELLLKLAWYVSESSEGHLRCRWGEGEGCYAGEVDDVPRWQKPSVYKLKFVEARTKEVLRDMVAINSFNRTKQVCELLHEAVSVANIDSSTRVDIAARCARMCLDGVKATQWTEASTAKRIKLPRKAAFFVVTAAEALSLARSGGAENQARDLWLLASQLYSKNPNPIDQGGDYGWAALRAITLNALAMHGNNPIALQAAEELLSLLCEISPRIPQGRAGQTSVPNRARRASTKSVAEQTPISQSGHGARKPPVPVRSTSNEGIEAAAANASTFARQLRDSFTTMTANSSILAMESKWADGDVIKPVAVPLAQQSDSHTMGCVWRTTSFDKAQTAQTECIDRITKLRRAQPTVSITHKIDTPGADTTKSLPLYVSSALKIQPEPSLELDRIVKKVKKDGQESQGAMATFYNPFDKKSAKGKIMIIAEGEERAITLEFANRLAVPLAVQRCQLEFENEGYGRIKATPIAFTLSPKATGFAVRFPFSVHTSAEVSDGTIFEVKGISMSLLGRVVFLPIHSTNQGPGEVDEKEVEKPRFETCPCQPRLLIHFSKSGAPVNPEKPVQISLANGEIFFLPSLHLKNYSGPSGHGTMEQLQIHAIDMPGLQDHKLFDSDEDMPALSEEAFTQQLIQDEKCPPLRVRVFTPSLKLDEVNNKDGSGSVVSFQIGAAHSMKRQIRNGAVVKIRFRYRGASTSSNYFWRKREILVRVSCVNGPGISSMDFRPDLAAGSAFTEMCRCLSKRRQLQQSATERRGSVEGKKESDGTNGLHRVGLDQGVHVSSLDVVFVLTVSNETTSEVVLHREGGEQVGGFSNSPLTTIQVHPGVSVKFPVVVPRIPRTKDDGSPTQLAKDVVSMTKLRWETKRGDGSSVSEVAKGYMRIPLKPLKEIIQKNPSFVSRICEPPCQIQLKVEGKSTAAAASSGGASVPLKTISLGKAVEIGAEVSVASWVPPHIASKCTLAVEFFCAAASGTNGTTDEGTTALVGNASPTREYVWCGKLKQEFPMEKTASDGDIKHKTKIAFVKPGIFLVSGCARIRHEDADAGEEIWWAPVAATFHVEKLRGNPAQ